MIDRNNVHQEPHEIIDVADWPVHADYEVFPVGARDKSLRICPSTCQFQFCLPGHKYLFKEAIASAKDPRKPRHPDQYWAEIIAFKIARLMGLHVPPAFVAKNSKTGKPGALIEWFTGYDPNEEERFTPGGDHMQDMIPDFDREKGEKHNLVSVITFARGMRQKGKLSHEWRDYWGLCLCFDALIGNTDRHQENWGVIWNDGSGRARLTPYFDNGTSLGHELFPNKFNKCVRDKNMLSAYIRRGRHHMRWALDDSERIGLMEGVIRFCQKYPDVTPLLIDSLSFQEESLSELLINLTQFDIESPLTEERAIFVHALTCERKRILLEGLESMDHEVY